MQFIIRRMCSNHLAVPAVLALASVITIASVLPSQRPLPPEVVRVDALLSRKAINERKRIYDEIWKTYGPLGNKYWKARQLRESQHFFKECQELLPHTVWISSWLDGFCASQRSGRSTRSRSVRGGSLIRRGKTIARSEPGCRTEGR